MKKLVCLIIAFGMFSNIAMAECKWATGVTKVETGYLYSNDCHGRVGLLVKDVDDYKIEVTELRKTIDLKDLALTKADQRVELWQTTAVKMEDRLNKVESAANTQKWIYLGLGVLTVFAAGYAAKQIYGGDR